MTFAVVTRRPWREKNTTATWNTITAPAALVPSAAGAALCAAKRRWLKAHCGTQRGSISACWRCRQLYKLVHAALGPAVALLATHKLHLGPGDRKTQSNRKCFCLFFFSHILNFLKPDTLGMRDPQIKQKGQEPRSLLSVCFR